MRREKRMQRKGKLEGGILIFLLLFSGLLLGQIQRKLVTDCFPVPVLESEAFRQLKLSPENYEKLLERCDGEAADGQGRRPQPWRLQTLI